MMKLSIRQCVLVLTSIFLLCFGVWYVGAEKIYIAFKSFNIETLSIVVLLLLVNLLIVSFRFSVLTIFFHSRLPFLSVIKANIQGNLASLFVISLFGQVIGRQQILKRYGLSPILIAMITAIERGGVALISGALSFIGAFVLLDMEEAKYMVDNPILVEFTIVAILAFLASLWINRVSKESRIILGLSSPKNLLRTFEFGLITVLAQIFMLGAFVVAGKSLSPELSWISLFAAASITSFVASLPISVNGWGTREVTAVFAFGYIGMPEYQALSTSLLIGICSSLVILFSYPWTVLIKDKHSLKSENSFQVNQSDNKNRETTKVAIWLLTLCTCVLIYFQLHVSFGQYLLNVNLADAFSLFSLAITTAYLVMFKFRITWKVKYFNSMLLAITCLIGLAYLNGVTLIGVTQWALAGRVFGWFVLLGYLSLGVLITCFMGKRGIKRAIETLSITAAVVIISQVVVRLLVLIGVAPQEWITYNFEGFSGNRNAFAFLLVICLILLISDKYRNRQYSNSHLLMSYKNYRGDFFLAIQSIMLTGIFLTGSRTGIITILLVLSFSWYCKITNRRIVNLTLIYSMFSWFFVDQIIPRVFKFIQNIYGDMFGIVGAQNFAVSRFSYPASNIERWETIKHGLEMWYSHPWFGAGLGVFIERSTQWFSHPIVIHSTPVWLLAEFGVIGTTIFFGVFIYILVICFQKRNISIRYGQIVLILLSFSIFGLAHEIFNQRVFWLGLGLCLAGSFMKSKPDRELV